MDSNNKQMITAKIKQKEYIFSYADYEEFYKSLVQCISKKSKLPEKIEKNSLLFKKRNSAISDCILNFLETKATQTSKKAKKDPYYDDMYKELLDDDDFEINDDDDKIVEEDIIQQSKSKKKNNKYLSVAQAFLQQKKQNLTKLLNNDKAPIKNEDKQIKSQGNKLNHFFQLQEEDNFPYSLSSNESNSNQDNYQSKQINFESNFMYGSRGSSLLDGTKPNQANIIFNIKNDDQEKLKKFYNKLNGDEKIFFQLLENQDQYSNMLERIVSSSSAGNNQEVNTCLMCLQLPIVPLKCLNCQMMVCAKCAFQWIQKKDQCPYGCSDTWKLAKPSEQELNTIVLQQYFYCSYKEFGCTETNKIQDVLSHEQNCKYKAVACQYCKTQIVNHKISEHEKQCEYRICKCKKCTFTYISKEKSTHNCIKTVLSHYNDLKKEFKQYQLDTEDKLSKIERSLNEAIDNNRTNSYRPKKFPYQEYNKPSKIYNNQVGRTGNNILNFQQFQDQSRNPILNQSNPSILPPNPNIQVRVGQNKQPENQAENPFANNLNKNNTVNMNQKLYPYMNPAQKNEQDVNKNNTDIFKFNNPFMNLKNPSQSIPNYPLENQNSLSAIPIPINFKEPQKIQENLSDQIKKSYLNIFHPPSTQFMVNPQFNFFQDQPVAQKNESDKQQSQSSGQLRINPVSKSNEIKNSLFSDKKKDNSADKNNSAENQFQNPNDLLFQPNQAINFDDSNDMFLNAPYNFPYFN